MAGTPVAVLGSPTRRRRLPALRRLRNGLLSATLALLVKLAGQLSWRRCQSLGRGLGRLAWKLGGRHRRRSLEHLAIAFPERSPAERREIARESYLHHGRSLGECLRLLSAGPADLERWVQVEGWENVEAAGTGGRPRLVLTGHCGNWELLAAVINQRGLGMKVVARELDQGGFQRLLLRLRERFGTATIERGGSGAARELLSTLRSGGALGMLIDQDTKVEGAWVPFFGRPAYTPLGAAKIAARVGAAVIPAFIERGADGRHLARFLPALELPADPVAATALMSEAIEAQIRRQPAQWVWMHRRWRRQPGPEPAAPEPPAP